MGRRGPLVLLVALCVTAGFFAGRAWWSLREPVPVLPPAPAARPAATRLPELSLPDLQGVPRSLGEWSSQALVLNFWATWCAPCRKEMPLLEQVHQERAGRNLAVVGIAIDRVEPVRTFVAETGVSYTILVGEEPAMAAAEAFGPDFMGLPLTVVAAPGGEVVGTHLGELKPADLATILEVLDRLQAGQLTVAGARAALTRNAPTGANPGG
jgi:thiol-disulfide isomerase/thioredoxin